MREVEPANVDDTDDETPAATVGLRDADGFRRRLPRVSCSRDWQIQFERVRGMHECDSRIGLDGVELGYRNRRAKDVAARKNVSVDRSSSRVIGPLRYLARDGLDPASQLLRRLPRTLGIELDEDVDEAV